jgi:hypothetical protein
MPTLTSDLRNKLERVIIEARDGAEVGARAALEALAVHHHEPYSHMKPAQRELRNHLRARARQLGDRQDATGRLAIDHLAGECAYEHWHRMLFARFLAENNLLIEPEDNMAISLAEAEELAKEEGVDVWIYASRCAQRMLPQIFRPGDPLLQVSFATEHMLKLEKLLASLLAAVFTASDALGWVYQFWQSKKKDEVNRSEVKIGADEISAVTQLFTEPYMVEFLLHNTLGAWWAGRKLSPKDAAGANSEDELRAKLALPGVGWEYLRFVRGTQDEGGLWRPAAGTFDFWPKSASELRVLDPCCGSGHFLVAALHHLVPIRMAEEDLPAREAVDAVLRDNLHGLEIDERCCQIAAFALAFAAWTYPDAGGYRPLPELQIACTGIGPQSTEELWVRLAEQSGMPTKNDLKERIKNGLLNLHRLFSQAPTLGSLIDPKQLKADVFAADYETIHPYLSSVLKAEKADDEIRERAIAAAGMVKAADLLAGEYTLVITNVPYLGMRKQGPRIREFCEMHYDDAKADLGTVMVVRSLRLLRKHGAAAVVLPRNFLFKDYFEVVRKRMLREKSWAFAAELGPSAFEGISGEVVDVALLCVNKEEPNSETLCLLLDVSDRPGAAAKARGLRSCELHVRCQEDLHKNPNARVGAGVKSAQHLLENEAIIPQGIKSGDDLRWLRRFWEIPPCLDGWQYCQTAVGESCHYGGLHMVVDWRTGGRGMVRPRVDCKALGKLGIGVTQTGTHRATLYLGTRFDSNIAPIVPLDPADLPAMWAYVSSADYPEALKRLSPGLFTTNSAFLKVEFDRTAWKGVAVEKYPHGLPEPESDDPTQWLFHGRPDEAQEGTELQVAVARLLGYRWPGEFDDKMRLSKRGRSLVAKCAELASFADNDGIVCIPAVRGEEPAAERLLKLMIACGIDPGLDLDDWLRNGFFEEHCKLFHDRPFVLHIWDGRKRDGFHALVNYHKLAGGGGKGRRLLESLTYAYLGDWITRQKDDVKHGEGGAEDRLAAAVELQNRLKAIIDGEPPFDIFVRWKPLFKQPIGWEPDINDGVRVNIRPFLVSDLPGGRTGAGVLRYKPNIKWTKDRGKEPERPKAEYPWFWNWDEKTPDFMGTGKEPDGNRHNDCHYTNKAKQTARDTAKGARRG